jgi:FtsZ-interacting cell division protein YlmF
MAYRSFEELEVWKRSCKLAVDTYIVLKEPKKYHQCSKASSTLKNQK